MTGISRKLPDTERARLKDPQGGRARHAGVIVRTAAEGASEEELRADVERLTKIWDEIRPRPSRPEEGRQGQRPRAAARRARPDVSGHPRRLQRGLRLARRRRRRGLGRDQDYVESSPPTCSAPDPLDRQADVFAEHRIDEQIAKAMDRKVWLPSGGSLVIDRTEAMTVVDVNTGKFVGSGGNLEETVTKNNLEAAEEIVRQLRLRDIGGIIVIDFIDMVLESNRDLVVRRLLECLGRDRTKHQVAEVTSLGLVQMTRKRVGPGWSRSSPRRASTAPGRGIIVESEFRPCTRLCAQVVARRRSPSATSSSSTRSARPATRSTCSRCWSSTVAP
jgi:ribonuclease E